MSEYIRHVSKFDEDNEKIIKQAVEEKWNCRLHKMPDWYGPDFVAYREDGTALAYIEVKTRKIPFEQYKDIICPVHKRQKCMALASAGGMSAIMMMMFSDGHIHWVDMFQPIDQVRMVSDKRARDKLDFSPHVYWKGACIKEL